MTIAAHFEELYKTYAALAEELGKAFGNSNTDRPESAPAAVFAQRECLGRIQQLNARVLEISAAWEKERALLDPEKQAEARYFISAARSEVLRLKGICDVHAQKLAALRTRILNDMADIVKGSRLLDSLKPVKHNYPKFIDSNF